VNGQGQNTKLDLTISNTICIFKKTYFFENRQRKIYINVL